MGGSTNAVGLNQLDLQIRDVNAKRLVCKILTQIAISIGRETLDVEKAVADEFFRWLPPIVDVNELGMTVLYAGPRIFHHGKWDEAWEIRRQDSPGGGKGRESDRVIDFGRSGGKL